MIQIIIPTENIIIEEHLGNTVLNISNSKRVKIYNTEAEVGKETIAFEMSINYIFETIVNLLESCKPGMTLDNSFSKNLEYVQE